MARAVTNFNMLNKTKEAEIKLEPDLEPSVSMASTTPTSTTSQLDYYDKNTVAAPPARQPPSFRPDRRLCWMKTSS